MASLKCFKKYVSMVIFYPKEISYKYLIIFFGCLGRAISIHMYACFIYKGEKKAKDECNKLSYIRYFCTSTE